ncbi:MAG: hypothetical protein K0R26_328 [Bacteroidota bacterium]|jgi:hypothetical protein|nr:hypothetical protein [Bacteroidota bacterium]
MKAPAAIHAGNITYSWIGPGAYTYQIKCTIYSTNTLTDNLCTLNMITFGNGTSGGFPRINGSCTGPCSPACEGVILPGGTIKQNEYVATHTYPGPGTYIISVDVANRNAGINNIPNSVQQIMHMSSLLVIPMFDTGKNNSPLFGNHPISSGCFNNGCFTYNPSATDMDGDSLSYELAMCKGYSVTAPGYSYPNPGAGGTFSIDPGTGTINWCNPQYNGDDNVVILIKEWRKNDDGDYYLIGYVERDTQFTISTCTGLKEQDDFEKQITVSPNPVQDYALLTLPSENLSILLTDVYGKIIVSENNLTSLSYRLNLENINHGIYFLKITDLNNLSVIKKLIKH